MAMSLGGSPHGKAQINVTPMIDILLVLLITFMLIQPSLSTGFKAAVPQPPDRKPSPPRDDIVISVLGDGTVRLNQESVAIRDLGGRLKAVLKNAGNHVIFVRGDRELDFQHIAEVIDIAKGAGLDRVALMTQ
jgi:biopolymer transport protein TolR